MRKLLSTSLLLGSLSTFAVPMSFYIEPYFTGINYSGSKIKKNGYAATLYGSISINNGVHVFEGAYGYTHLNYKNSNSNWNQDDYAIAYTNYMFWPLYFKLGYHYIATPNNEDVSNNANIYFADIGVIEKYKYSYGVFTSYSNYRYSVAATEIRPHAGFYRWLDYYRGFYFSFDGTWINLKKPKNVGLTQKNYLSLGAGVTYFTSLYSVKLSLWGGKRVFMVDNSGFVVYNLREKYKYGASVSGRYYLNKQLSVNLQLGYSRYKEISTKKNVDVYTTTFSIGYSF